MRPNFNRLFKPEYVKAMNANKDSKVSYHDYIQSKLAEARMEGKEAREGQVSYLARNPYCGRL